MSTGVASFLVASKLFLLPKLVRARNNLREGNQDSITVREGGSMIFLSCAKGLTGETTWLWREFLFDIKHLWKSLLV